MAELRQSSYIETILHDEAAGFADSLAGATFRPESWRGKKGEWNLNLNLAVPVSQRNVILKYSMYF